jgi:acetyltransferase-like isoleucine patch superfamily enzyme
MSLERKVWNLVKPVAKQLLYRGVRPGPVTRRLFLGAYYASDLSREACEWAFRALVSTPMFLSRCAVFGEDISVDGLPYIYGPVRIELGSNIRLSTPLAIKGSSHTEAVLRIGNGVYIGGGCSIAVGRLVEIGNFVAIGTGTYIADTEGHSHQGTDRPVWEDPPTERDIAPVFIEDNVRIARQCMILKGVRIGRNSVIGSGSVVRTSVPPNSVIMGNPARAVNWRRPAGQGSGGGEE